MNLQKKKRGFLFLVVVLIGLTIGVIFYGRYQTVQRKEEKKVEQEKETSIERESRQAEQLPEQLPEPADTDFVRIMDYIPDIVIDLKYATTDNFTGTVIYDFKDAYLRYGTVKKLAVAQEKFKSMGYYIKIWDAYRPFAAQEKLWQVCPNPRYVANPANGMKAHNLGGTIDMTLVTFAGNEVEMPTAFDDFSFKADRDYSDVWETAAENAGRRESVMIEGGFIGYELEGGEDSDTTAYEAYDFMLFQ